MGCGNSSPSGIADDQNLMENLVWHRTINPQSIFEIVREIGEGGMGALVLGRKMKRGDELKIISNTTNQSKEEEEEEEKRLFALKTVHVNRVKENLWKEFENEIQILQTLDQFFNFKR